MTSTDLTRREDPAVLREYYRQMALKIGRAHV